MENEMNAYRYINEYSGFFSGDRPTLDDVGAYFTAENFEKMFRDSSLPPGLSFDDLRNAARDILLTA